MSFLGNLRALLTFGKGTLGKLSPLAHAPDPIEYFKEWLGAAQRAGIFLPEAMTLATATADGAPSARMMLLKGVDEYGFRFFTNYESRKSNDLDENPRAAVVLHWPVLERQVRVEGRVERLSEEESQAYFRKRPREARIGAWASEQSRPLESRAELEQRVVDCQQRFAGDDVPLPPNWGGFRLIPTRIEFWQGRLNRLHDRLQYDRDGDGWTVQRVYP